MNFAVANPGVRAADILPSRRKLSEYVGKVAQNLKGQINETIASAVERQAICFSADMWSCANTKDKYLDISIQYFEEDWTLKNGQMAMIHFPERHDHVNIREKIDGILMEIPNLDKSQCIFVTDSGANIVKACRDYYVHYRCLAHRYSTALTIGYESACKESSLLDSVERDTNSLIGYFNHSEKNKNLPIRLKSGSRTRPWRHLHEKFYSINESYDEILKILTPLGQEYKLTRYLRNMIVYLEKIFSLFKSVFDILEPVKTINISKVVPTYFVLLDKLDKILIQFECEYPKDVYSQETEAIEILIENLKYSVSSKIEIHSIYLAASFLDPEFKDFNLIPRKEESFAAAKKFIVSCCEIHQITPEAPKQPAGDDFLASARSASIQISSPIEDEIERYSSEKFSSKTLNAFWQSNTSKYPILSQIARRILVIPATSSGPERHFSISGKVGAPDRSLLHPEKLCLQSFVANNLKYNNRVL